MDDGGDSPLGLLFPDLIRDYGERSSPGAVSPKGARGVMQVMPQTALSPGFGLAPVNPNDPAAMERLGQQYARTMLARYGGNQVLAAAAYNAGPGRVDQWLQEFGDPRTGKISTAEWASRIPFQETRDYVTRIGQASGLGLGFGLGQKGYPTQMAQGANPLALPEPSAPSDETQPEASAPGPDPRAAFTMQLLKMLVPKTHTLVPVDYDPWAVIGDRPSAKPA